MVSSRKDAQHQLLGKFGHEAIFLNLKMECVWQREYGNHTEAMNDIADYIVSFCNSERLHSKLGNLQPNVFVQKSAIKQFTGLS